MFLNSTRDRAAAFVFNTSSFISENDRLIDQIDGIITGLAEMHNRLNTVCDLEVCLVLKYCFTYTHPYLSSITPSLHPHTLD